MIDSLHPTEAEYIQHHLTYYQLNLRTFTIENSKDFWTLNLDTLSLTIFSGILIVSLFYYVIKNFSSERPGKLQTAVEMAVESLQNLIKEMFRGEDKLIAPLALTIFSWVFVLNAFDLVPVDLLPRLLLFFGIEHFRTVPTDDVNLTFALSFSVFLLVIYYNFKGKGCINLTKEVSPTSILPASAAND